MVHTVVNEGEETHDYFLVHPKVPSPRKSHPSFVFYFLLHFFMKKNFIFLLTTTDMGE